MLRAGHEAHAPGDGLATWIDLHPLCSEQEQPETRSPVIVTVVMPANTCRVHLSTAVYRLWLQANNASIRIQCELSI